MRPTFLDMKSLQFWILLVILIAGGLIRGYDLGSECFDCDELYAVRIQGIGPKTVAQVVARDGFHTNHPPLMTVPYLFWIALVGPTETAVRTLPLLMGLVTIGLIYHLGIRFGNPWAGLIAASLLAINPLHIAYAREARQYELLAALAVAAHLCLLNCLERGRRSDQLLYVVACIFLAMTHYFGVIALTGHGLLCAWLLLVGDRSAKQATVRCSMCLILAALPCLGWLPVTRFQMSTPWRHLSQADFAGFRESLPDVIGVRNEWDQGLLGVLLVVGIVGLGCWKNRRCFLAAAGVDRNSPLSRVWGMGILVVGILSFVLVLSPLSKPLMASARETLVRYNYSGEEIERETLTLRQLLLASTLALTMTGIMLIAWRRAEAIALSWVQRLRPTERKVDVGTVLAALILAPILTTWLIGLTGVAFLQTRNLIILVPPICLGVGLGLQSLWTSRPGRGLALGVSALLLAFTFQYWPLASVLGRDGYNLGMKTYKWKLLDRYLHSTESIRMPLLACKTAATDPLLHYQKDRKPRRLSVTDGGLLDLPARFYFVHIDRDAESETILQSLKARGLGSNLVFHDERLELFDLHAAEPVPH